MSDRKGRAELLVHLQEFLKHTTAVIE